MKSLGLSRASASSDAVGVLQFQGTGLDFIYLERWAKALALEELLRHAFAAAR